MNYSEFKIHAAALDDTHPSCTRLDDLNPFTIELKSKSAKVSAKNWFIEHIPYNSDYIITGTGIRQLLEVILSKLKEYCDEILLPGDIYPVYDQIAEKFFQLRSHFSTFPELELEFPNAERTVILIADPLIPAGRYLTKSEYMMLDEWITTGTQRYVIVDHCYDFTLKHQPTKRKGWIHLFSASKLFLSNRSFGIAYLPEDYEIESLEVDLNICSSTPALLSDSFKETWMNLSPKLQQIAPKWTPPEVGYLSTINVPYEELLRRDLAGIPASVFGSEKHSISIVSCLNALKNDLH